jgi:predicted nucleotidyltransferase
MLSDVQWLQEAVRHPYPLLFLTLSGAHLYGFPSPDSDYDLRGVHVLPIQQVVGLYARRDTIESTTVHEGRVIDLVTHDIEKCCRQLLKKDGTILEHLYAPLVLQTSPEHEELQAIAKACITRQHYYHYLGLGRSQWRLVTRASPPPVKPLLYVYRALLTGTHLMRSGEVEANLERLAATFHLPYIAALMARKRTGSEHVSLVDTELQFYQEEYTRLCHVLEEASQASHLPATPPPTAKAALHDLLVRIRLGRRAQCDGV